MTDAPNPYSVPIDDGSVEVESLCEPWFQSPIAFYGTLQREDGESEIDWRGWKSAVEVLSRHALLVVAVMATVVIGLRIAMGDHTPGFFFLLTALAMMPAWRRFFHFLIGRWPQTRPVAAKSWAPFSGFIDSWGVCCIADTYVVKIPWSELSVVNLLPEMIRLDVRNGANEIWLPCRFFKNEADYQQARLVSYRYCRGATDVPIATELTGLTIPGTPLMGEAEIAEANRWSDEDWPFDRMGQTVQVEGSGGSQASWGQTIGQLVWQVCKSVVFGFPVLIAFTIWLFVDRNQFGAWDYLWSPIAILCLLWMGLMIIWQASATVVVFRAWLRDRAEPFSIQLDRAGYFLQQGPYQCWAKWSPANRFDVTEEGMICSGPMAEHGLMIPRSAFTAETLGEIESLLGVIQTDQ